MRENVVFEKAFSFAVVIVGIYKNLVTANNEYVLSNQLLRSGTSIGANVTEANGAISKSDFSAKISIAYKESLETKYWLELLFKTNYIGKDVFERTYKCADELSKLLFSIIKTSRIKT